MTVAPFRLARVAVTNRLFARFVAETGYRTTAEREGWSFVFHAFLPGGGAGLRGPVQAPWWRQVHGACWSAPFGPGSGVTDRMDHPVTHVSHDDARAFCAHTGTRLPDEAEWELAARGGLAGARFPWGDEMTPEGRHRANTFQGAFPGHDSGEDGHVGTAPVDAYDPNGLGLSNMTGNVWEWVADSAGPLPGSDGARDDRLRVTRGGSYLCHASYCERYFVHSRTFNTPDSSTSHTGFRIAAARQAGG
ncbi:SUMF1/EgtB/PvdO family nonheme iron enzyme [Paracoccus sp. p4-l81]|uniref:SUMF1/EgtB/PvdO family nonheme iron enzyme n=1 Tax=Paracoccus sp. p4-l81 TaxID=3342806 RepID=UPI0035B6F741